MAVEAVASAIRVGCPQGLEARGSIAGQQVLCAVRSHRYRNMMPSSVAEERRVD